MDPDSLPLIRLAHIKAAINNLMENTGHISVSITDPLILMKHAVVICHSCAHLLCFGLSTVLQTPWYQGPPWIQLQPAGLKRSGKYPSSGTIYYLWHSLCMISGFQPAKHIYHRLGTLTHQHGSSVHTTNRNTGGVYLWTTTWKPPIGVHM